MIPPAFARYIAPARSHPQVWRLVLGLVIVLAVYLLWVIIMGGGIWLAVGSEGFVRLMPDLAQGSSPATLIWLLFTFTGMGLGTFAAVRLVHKRSARSLFGRAPVVLRDFALGVGVLALVFLAGLAAWPGKAELLGGLDFSLWLMLLPVALLGVLVQTGAEELVFRGYLQQQLAARFASPLIWMLLPSIAFGIVHYEPETRGANAWYIVAATGFFGLVAADLTARSGSLGLAWGLHFVNNVFALLIITAGGGLDGLALFRFPFGPDNTEVMRPLILADMAMLAVAWGICRLVLRGR